MAIPFNIQISNNSKFKEYLAGKFDDKIIKTVNNNSSSLNESKSDINKVLEVEPKIMTCHISKKLIEKSIRNHKSELSDDDLKTFDTIIENVEKSIYEKNIDLFDSSNNYGLDISSLESLKNGLINMNKEKNLDENKKNSSELPSIIKFRKDSSR